MRLADTGLNDLRESGPEGNVVLVEEGRELGVSVNIVPDPPRRLVAVFLGVTEEDGHFRWRQADGGGRLRGVGLALQASQQQLAQ